MVCHLPLCIRRSGHLRGSRVLISSSIITLFSLARSLRLAGIDLNNYLWTIKVDSNFRIGDLRRTLDTEKDAEKDSLLNKNRYIHQEQ